MKKKKTIGLLTYCNYYNYGSMLQGFALQKYINSTFDDVDCEIINYRNQVEYKKSKVALLKLRLSRLVFYLSHLKKVYIVTEYAKKMSIRNEKFDIFFKEYMKSSSRLYHSKEDLFKDVPIYDKYLIGSDQTWNPLICGGYKNSPMFLDFVNNDSPKYAYAPSVGVQSLSSEVSDYYKNKLASFKMISCREISGANLLSRIIEKDVKTVVDPTLLITGDNWKQIVPSPIIKSSYIFCYFLGERDYYRNFAKQLSNQTGLPLYYIPCNWKDCNKRNNMIWDAGPLDFVSIIANATYVLTDSFHGVAFSANLNKNFYAFVKHPGNDLDNSRLFDFCERFKLKSRLIQQYEGGLVDMHPVDYTMTNKCLQKERDYSYEFIYNIFEM